ncbi:unnamed protein product, partial [Rotaria magnacalcarata]
NDMNTSLNTRDTNLTSLIIEGINASEIINSTVTTITTKTSTIKTSTSILFRLFNGTRTYPFLRQSVATTTASSSSSLFNKYFILKSQFHRDLRYAELAILSLALPLYVIVFILFIRLTVSRISRNTAISGGGSRSRSQRRRQR